MLLKRRRKIKPKIGAKGQFHFSSEMKRPLEKAKEPELPRLEPPREKYIDYHSADDLLSWRAPEFEMFQRDRKWYIYVTLALLGIIIYAIVVNALVMAITFILAGVVGYIYINSQPRVMTFMITDEGIVAGRDIYEFKNLLSFWIFYEPEGIRVISLHTTSHLVPYVHIPIHDQDPARIREILLEFIPEEKHEPGFVETLDRILKL